MRRRGETSIRCRPPRADDNRATAVLASAHLGPRRTPVVAVMRIGHVSVRVTDIEKARDHYSNVIGLIETHRESGGTTYYKAWDEWDRYSVVLTPADNPGANYIAYKVERDADLDSIGEGAA